MLKGHVRFDKLYYRKIDKIYTLNYGLRIMEIGNFYGTYVYNENTKYFDGK